MDLRHEAEERMQKQRQLRTSRSGKRRLFGSFNRGKSKPKILFDMSSIAVENTTPQIAALAEVDYKLNGNRARLGINAFIGPRWVPDQEADSCSLCTSEFNWFVRKHHCRHCGKIFCNSCSYKRSLLPGEFGLRDPQRVCLYCHEGLLPHQSTLTNDIANHQRLNSVDIVSRSNIRRYCNMPFALTMGSEIRKASYTAYNFINSNFFGDKNIPLKMLHGAKGLAFLTVIKGGILVAPRLGTGLVIARLASGEWSAPSAVGMAGVSLGLVAGADVTDYMIVLNSPEAVSAFKGCCHLSIGVGVEFAIGTLGRCATASVTFGDHSCFTPVFSYSHCRGMFLGASLESVALCPRSDVNHRFYGRQVTPDQLLCGLVPPPRAAIPLYEALEAAAAALPQPTYLFMLARAAQKERSTALGITALSLSSAVPFDIAATSAAPATETTPLLNSMYPVSMS